MQWAETVSKIRDDAAPCRNVGLVLVIVPNNTKLSKRKRTAMAVEDTLSSQVALTLVL